MWGSVAHAIDIFSLEMRTIAATTRYENGGPYAARRVHTLSRGTKVCREGVQRGCILWTWKPVDTDNVYAPPSMLTRHQLVDTMDQHFDKADS